MAQLAPMQINKQRRQVVALPPPPTPTALTLVKSLVSLTRVVSACGKPKVCQKRNASNIVRRIELLLPLFEEIRESRLPLPPSAVSSFRELHGIMQRVCMLLDECRESSCFWLLVEQETYCQHFHELTQSLGSALQSIPLELLDVSDEIREQTALVRMQVLRARLNLDPAELQLREDVVNLLKQVELKEIPDAALLQHAFTLLQLLNARDCQTEIHRLEEITTEAGRNDTNTKTHIALSSLICFVRYGKCVLYSEDFAEQDDDTSQSFGGQDSGEASTGGTRGEDAGASICPPVEFLCPITLDLMRDPVIVATGQTYDRKSITRWLEEGHSTCPKSGQDLEHNCVISNYALRSLISQWCEDNNVPFEGAGNRGKRGAGIDHVASLQAGIEASKLTATFLVGKLRTGRAEVKKQVAHELRLLAKCGVESRKCIGETGGIPLLVPLLSSSDPKTQEHAVTALLNLSIFEENKKLIIESGALDLIIQVLKAGKTLESRENAAATLFSLSSTMDDLKVQIGSKLDAIPSLVTLLQEGSAPRGKKDAATALFNLAVYHGNKTKIIEAGAVPMLVSLLKDETSTIADDYLAVLGLLASFPEGAEAIGETTAIPILVSFLRSGSPKGKEVATSVLLELCKSGNKKILQSVLQLAGTIVPCLYHLIAVGSLRAKRKAGSLLKLFYRVDHAITARARPQTTNV